LRLTQGLSITAAGLSPSIATHGLGKFLSFFSKQEDKDNKHTKITTSLNIKISSLKVDKIYNTQNRNTSQEHDYNNITNL
jgi:transposase